VEAPTAERERLVCAYTGLEAYTPVPRPEALHRQGWIEANLKSLETVLEPAAQRLAVGVGPLGSLAGGLLAIEAGAVSGFLAGRVLGQYDFPVLDPEAPARLLYVAPNLAQAASALEAEPEQLLRWVALHETTHALQFGGVDWLRPYLAETVTDLLGALQVNPRAFMRLPDVADLRRLFEQVREDGGAPSSIACRRSWPCSRAMPST
jgi:putative hydrolase